MVKKKVHFPGLSKRKLSEFNKAEAQGWVIDQFIEIEERINNSIVKHFKPEDENLFKSVVLNSSIINIGSKIKILVNIGISNNTSDKLRKLAAIRNGFAHTRIGSQMNIIVPAESEIAKKIEVHAESFIDVMNSSGKIIRKNAHEYLSEYLDLLQAIKKEL